jgi:hypothetical protein
MDDTAAALVKRLSSLRSLRSRHESTWRECFDYTFPIRGEEFFASSPDAHTALAKRAKLMDSTLSDSAASLASALMSGLTPSNSIWFDQTVDGVNDAEKRWLGEASEVTWANIHGANYDAAGFECALDATVAGWFVLFIDDDRKEGGLHFEQWPLGQCYIACSKPGGAVDMVDRCYEVTAEQCVNEFGDKCSERVKELAARAPDTMVELVRCIKPNKDHREGSMLSKNLPFHSYTIELQGKTMLREAGYHEFPCVVPRWWLIPKSVYATGQALQALPDARSLNSLLIMEEMAADIAVSGMWIAEDDGVLNPRTIKVGPRKVIVANSVDSMKALQSGADFNVSFTKGDQKRAAIRKTMMTTYLEPRDGPVPTATQVHVDVGLLRQLLGPVFGRMQAEWLAPMVERCFGLCYRQGRPELGGAPGMKIIEDPPESLADRVIQVKYKSPMARAQKLEEVTAIERWFQDVGAIAASKPGVLDLVDEMEAGRVIGDALGVPPKVVRDERQIALLRKEREQQQAQAAQQAQAQNQQAAMTDAMAQRVATAQ